METINVDGAPAAIGPYSHAVKAGDFYFCSGQTPVNPETMQLVGDDIATQTRQVFENIKTVLAGLGCSLNDVVKTTVFLKSMDDFQGMNAVYAESFGDHKPARSTIAVRQNPMDCMVEIECIVFAGK